MPEHSGLEILNFIEKEIYNFEIIFTTAYNDYAIQAFQLNAIDYLLKPVSAHKIKEATDKALKFLGASKIDKRLEELKKSFAENNFSKIGYLKELPSGGFSNQSLKGFVLDLFE